MKLIRALMALGAPLLLLACSDKPSDPAPVPQSKPSASPVEHFVVAQQGDTLSKLAGQNWEKVCEHNKRTKRLTDCDRIKIGQRIEFPVGLAPAVKRDAEPQLPAARPVKTQTKASPSPKASAAAKPAKKQTPVVAKSKVSAPAPKKSVRDAEGWWHWRNVGGASLKKCPGTHMSRLEAFMTARDFSDTEKEELRRLIADGKYEPVSVPRGAKYDSMTFCKGGKMALVEKVVLDDPDTAVTAKRFTLSSGRLVEDIDQCGNWAERSQELPPPPPAEAVPPPPPPPPPPPLPPTPPKEKDKDCGEPKGVVGAEYNANNVASVFLDGALYCMYQVEGGRDGFGLGVKGSAYDGNVKNGPGHFDGYNVGAGVAFRQQRDKGTDTEYKVMFMGLHGKYRETDYVFRQNYVGVGASFARSDFSRRLKGKKAFNENQQYAFCFLPVAGGKKHSWQGQRLPNPGDLSFLCNVGGRLYLYEFKTGSIYLQAGLLGEFGRPSDIVTCSTRVGLANKHRYFGIGVGFDCTIIGKGGIVLAGGLWWDPFLHLSTDRAKARRDLIRDVPDDESVTFEDQPVGQDLLHPMGSASQEQASLGADQVPDHMVASPPDNPTALSNGLTAGDGVAANDNGRSASSQGFNAGDGVAANDNGSSAEVGVVPLAHAASP